MAKYKAVGWFKKTGIEKESAVTDTDNAALGSLLQFDTLDNFKVVTILCDQKGEDHPDNAGKFFLHRIVK
jgi:hypothetical protein